MRLRRKIFLGAFLVLVAGLILAPCIMDQEDRDMDAAARKKLDGHQFVDLPMGNTHYQLTPPSSQGKPTVVFLHGTSGPMTIWDETVEPVALAGYQALRFDFFGRGYSARLDRTNNLEFFTQQLSELLSALAIEGKLVLVGSSLGAIVAAEFALQHPDRISAVVFIGPAGFPLEASFLAKLALVPWLGDYLIRVVGDKKLVEHHRKYFVATKDFEDRHQAFGDMLRYRGTKASILSTLRNSPLQTYVDSFTQFGATQIPCLLIWGQDDRTFPFSNHTTMQTSVPQAELIAIEAGAHLPMLEKPDEVNAALLEFLP